MLRAIGTSLLSIAMVASLASATLAGTDEYQGDTTIYSGLPATMTKPNVLIIVDNSRATLNTAPGFPYDPDTTYSGSADCASGVSNPRLGCYLPWYIYTIDNQGDVANQHVLANSTPDLENLKRPTDVETPTSADTSSTCNGSDDVIRKTLQLRGTYSGSGTESFPNINSNTGGCDTSPKGAVYVLGNYLNYTRSTTSTTYAPGTPEICKAPNPIIKQTVVVKYCTLGNRTLADCPQDKVATLTQTAFYQVKQTHIADTTNQPGSGATWQNYWVERVTADTTTPEWVSGKEYRVTADVVVEGAGGEAKTCAAWISTTTASQQTQREIMYGALREAVGSSLGAANFGAMVYGGNNSGGNLIFHMTDLSREGDVIKPLAPDCSSSTNKNLSFCQFLAALPGSGQSGTSPLGKPNNIAPIASNTIRPQAESVFDAGYYFGAFNDGASVTNVLRIPDAIKNECGLNHVILLTNGLTNGDGSPKLKIVGDADGDGYPDESVYGLGSHWLDDVAKYLNVHYGITTHTVLAFQERDALVENAAKDGRGKFFNVYSAEELSAALLKLLASIINEANTSFVAPVVPASTTNRTVSSNKVYLGLFRPQTEGPWHGNVKKYSIGLGNQLLAADGQPATDLYGNFDRDSISYWSLRSDGLISSAEGDINPAHSDPNKPKGDGGQVDAGGAGGKLLRHLELLAAATRNSGWEQTAVPWRKIYTYLTPDNSDVSTADPFLPSEQNHFLPGKAGNLSALDADYPEALIRYIHGFEYDEIGLPGNATARRWVMGDVLHSRPLVFNYSKYSDIHENLCSPGNDDRYNSSIIFVGANDGMLHAFRDCDGSELWAFIPPEHLSSLKNIKDPLSPGGHPTFVDGAPSAFVHDANGDGLIDPLTDKVVLLFGLRRGGGSNDPADREQGAYYALDVTTPDQPVFLWRTGYAAGNERDEFAQTWTQPRQAKLKIDDNHFKVVMFVGAGYDTNEDTRYGNTQQFLCNNTTPQASRPLACTDTNQAPIGGTVDGSGDPQTSDGSAVADNRLAPRGRGIYAIEVADMIREAPNTVFEPSVDGTNAGSIYWSYRPANNGDLDYSFAGDLAVLDSNNDGYADLLYAADTGGNLWRFNLGAADTQLWNGEIIFRSNPGSDGTNGRKIFYRPVVANIGGAPHIYFGTGDREHPLNLAVNDRIYCIIDWKAIDPSLTYPINETSLEDVTANLIQKADTDPAEVKAIYERLYSRPDHPYDSSGNFRYGWYIKLDGGDRKIGGDPGEKVLAAATVFNGQVFFTTYQPKLGVAAGCDPGNLGISRLYHLDYKTGEAVYNYDLSNDLNAVDETVNERALAGPDGALLQRSDRVRTLGEGIPSGIVTLLDASGKVTVLISSSDKVEAFGLPDVKLIMPVYWMQW